jgi:AraC family transcriptional regulator, ethanolamine operon transcriptional activator
MEHPTAFFQVLNPEQLATAIRSADFEPCQLSSSPMPSRLARLMGPGNVCLDFAELGPAMLFTGLMSVDCYTLVFVTRCPVKGHSFNFATEHLDGYMGFFPPGGLLDAFTPQGYSNATLTVPAEQFHQALERWFPEIPDTLLKRGAGMRIGEVEQRQLRHLISTVLEGIQDPAGPFSDGWARGEMEEMLLESFLIALRSGAGGLVPVPNSRVAGRLKHLREAREFIRSSARGPIRLEDVSEALGMSARGVEALFRSSLGVGPTAYIRHQRLHAVRQSLLTAMPGPGVIKETAMQWGFWHMGHFSKNYRQLFGESPMQTLAARQ